jgi:tRNA pseudouridine55 synthase
MQDGILLIDKPAGMSSFGVVARIRRVLSSEQKRKVKVGHTGTLDPFATGLLILVVGKECKNAANYSKSDKIYEAVFRLGQTSTTDDPEGEITDVSDVVVDRASLESAVKELTGQITQTPPIYSAIKINGQRAYNLARKGQEVEMPVRTVTVHSLEITDYNYPLVSLRAHVSSGTYIRSLAREIGDRLGVGAYCQELRRVSVGQYSVENAATLASFGIEN